MRFGALVTGASKRIGRAVALQLADSGYDIVIHYWSSSEEAQKLQKVIESKGCRAFLVQGDLALEDNVQTIWDEACTQAPGLSVLVNSASIFEPSGLKMMAMNDFDQHVNINLKVPLMLMQAMAKSVTQGLVINFLDTRIERDHADYFAYNLSKKALREVTRMAALELAPSIRVNAIAPGYILPGHRTHDDLIQNIPLARRGSLKEIQECVNYLVTNTFVTGQVLYCDGGEHLVP